MVNQQLESTGSAAAHIAVLLGLVPDEWTVCSELVGAGQVAQCRRWEFRRGDAVVRAVAKTPSANEVSRQTARIQHLYRREASFYRELQPRVRITTPEVLSVSYDPETDDFLILLSDLTPAAPVDQFAGVAVDTVSRALDELVGLHGPTANREEIFGLPWLAGVARDLGPLYEAVLPGLFDTFLATFGDQLSADAADLVAQLAPRLGRLVGHDPALRCVVHGDFRVENLIVDGRAGAVPLAVVDWQTVSVGSPFLDVAYFITTSLTPSERATHERALLEQYRGRLASEGFVVPPDDARRQYARYTLQPVLMLVAASGLVERTARGDAMFLTMIERGVAAALAWDALGELD